MNLLGSRMKPSGVSFSSFSTACKRSDINTKLYNIEEPLRYHGEGCSA
jgi:hypothetical protein